MYLFCIVLKKKQTYHYFPCVKRFITQLLQKDVISNVRLYVTHKKIIVQLRPTLAIRGHEKNMATVCDTNGRPA